jgi:photosystem II stability/assembly factor-like uncharacterized protein
MISIGKPRKYWCNMRGKRLSAGTILGFLVASCAYAHAPHDVVQSIAISPHYVADHTVYALVRSNVLKSTDGGISWKRLVRGLDNIESLSRLAIDPTNPDILYVSSAADGIYKTINAGGSWSKVSSGLAAMGYQNIYIPPAMVRVFAFALGASRGVYRTSDAGANWIRVHDGAVPLSAIAGFAWNPTEGREVLIGDRKGTLYLSKDAGLHWGKLYTFTGCGEVTNIATLDKPLLRQIFFVGTSACGVFRTTDGGQSFDAMNIGIDDPNVRGVAMSPEFQHDATVFVTTGSKAVYISNNAGLTWSLHEQGVVTDPQGEGHKFLGVRPSPNYREDKTLFLEGFSGIFKSSNGGYSWSEMDAMPKTLIQSVALSPSYTKDASLAVSTYLNGLYKSHNSGDSWTSMADGLSARNSDITYSPSYWVDRVLLFAAIGLPNRIIKSNDGGGTWTKRDMECIPTILGISPDFARDQTLYAACRSTILLRSNDAGESYALVYREAVGDSCPYCVSALALSPNFKNDHTILYATETADSGVQVSRNGGDSWLTKGSKATYGRHIKVAFSPEYAVDHTVFIGGGKGLFRSEDGLESWRKITGDANGIDGYIEELAVSPDFKNDHTLLISVRGKGLFKSVDRGDSFRTVGASLIANNHVFGLWDDFPVATSSLIRFSADYAIDKTIYGCSSDWLFRSRDGGESWSAILQHNRLKPSVDNPILPEPIVTPPQTVSASNVSPVYPRPHAHLTVVKKGRGQGRVSSFPKGIDCGDSCSYQFTKKTKVRLMAIPENGSRFARWGGNCPRKKILCTIKLKKDKRINVRFRLKK